MKSYKEFPKVIIGGSDMASLTIRSVMTVDLLRFGEDSDYDAYECIGDDVKIGDHYTKVFSGDTWLMLYDDLGLVYKKYMPDGYEKFDIYRAGERGCIIHWHS